MWMGVHVMRLVWCPFRHESRSELHPMACRVCCAAHVVASDEEIHFRNASVKLRCYVCGSCRRVRNVELLNKSGKLSNTCLINKSGTARLEWCRTVWQALWVKSFWKCAEEARTADWNCAEQFGKRRNSWSQFAEGNTVHGWARRAEISW